MVVILSVGHTANEPGASANGLVEFDVAKKIVIEAGNLLKAENIDVIIVPFDLDLRSTIDWINNSGYSASNGDICIDVHVNDGGKSGIEGWYRGTAPNESSLLTESIVNSTSMVSGLPFLGAKSEYEHPFGSLAFVHAVNPISSLIECGYIDNPVDSALMKSDEGIKKFAKGLVDGIKSFLRKRMKGKSRQTDFSQDLIQEVSQVSSHQRVGGIRRRSAAQFQRYSYSRRADRTELIKALYREVLGREADEKGLFYYIYANPKATEDEIRKEMTQSTEHFEILQRARKAKEFEQRLKKIEAELRLTKVSLEAKENEIVNLDRLLKLKTDEMMKMSRQLQRRNNVFDGAGSTPQVVVPHTPGVDTTTHTTQVQNQAQKDLTYKRKGCLGWLKELLGF